MQNSDSGSRIRMLLVEDDQVDQMAFQRAVRLDDLPYNFVVAGSVAQATEILEQSDFDVIVCDYSLGDGTAFDVLEARKEVPVIFITGIGDEEVAVKAMKSGASDYLVKDPQGHYLKILPVTVEAVIWQKTAEDQLRATKERYRLVADTSSDVIITINEQSRILFANAAVERIFGFRVTEVIDQPVTMLIPERLRADYLNALAAFLSTGGDQKSWEAVEFPGLHKDGHEIPLEISVGELVEDGKHLFTGIIRDITERKRVEKELKEAHRRKDEFLAMLAHELRNPLAPLRNAAEVMRLLPNVDPKLQWAEEVVVRQVQHLTRLVDDLLDVSRITSGKIGLQKEELELESVMLRAVETSRPLIDARGHELIVSLPAERLRLYADPTRLSQLLANLLNNAAKYTESGGRIWFSAERAGGEAVIRVKDTGIGIPGEMLPRVFDLFAQADRSLERSQGGLGIGLTLVRSLVEMHGGTVQASSEGPGKGSEFTIRLPAMKPVREVEEASNQPALFASMSGITRRLLVVDDNVDSAESLGMLLSLIGHDVRIAHNGLAALELFRTFQPEIAFLDIGLPGMDGYELARRIRQDAATGSIQLVALTGYGQEEDRRRALEAGFNHHLVKPVDPAALQKFLTDELARDGCG
ncbi:MAG TPA: response regulator [Acidobacteriota bacterium]